MLVLSYLWILLFVYGNPCSVVFVCTDLCICASMFCLICESWCLYSWMLALLYLWLVLFLFPNPGHVTFVNPCFVFLLILLFVFVNPWSVVIENLGICICTMYRVHSRSVLFANPAICIWGSFLCCICDSFYLYFQIMLFVWILQFVFVNPPCFLQNVWAPLRPWNGI